MANQTLTLRRTVFPLPEQVVRNAGGLLILLTGLVATILVASRYPLPFLGIVGATIAFCVAIHNFVWGVSLLIVTLYFPHPLIVQPAIRLSDVMAIIVFCAFLVRRLMVGSLSWRRTPLDYPIAAMLISISLSLAVANFSYNALMGFARFLEIFAFLYAIAQEVKFKDVPRLLRAYANISAAFSLVVLAELMKTGGAVRVWGLAGGYHTGLVGVAIPIAFALFLYEHRGHRVWFRGAVFVTLIVSLLATQTRGFSIAVALTLIVAGLFAVSRSSLAKAVVRRRLFSLVFVSVLFGAGIFLIYPSFFFGVEHRFASLTYGVVGTVQLRYFLWWLALQLFFTHPLLGAGLKQFEVAKARFFPHLQQSEMLIRVKDTYAHNQILTLLSEQGLVGLTALLWLFLTYFRLASHAFLRAAASQQATALALLGGACFVIISSTFVGEWFQPISSIQFMFLLGLTTAYTRDALREDP